MTNKYSCTISVQVFWWSAREQVQNMIFYDMGEGGLERGQIVSYNAWTAPYYNSRKRINAWKTSLCLCNVFLLDNTNTPILWTHSLKSEHWNIKRQKMSTHFEDTEQTLKKTISTLALFCSKAHSCYFFQNI